MKQNVTQYLWKELENNHNNEWKKLPHKPCKNDLHSLLIAIDPTKVLLNNKSKLSNAVIIGTYQPTHQLIEMLQNDNLEIAYFSVKDKDKIRAQPRLSRAINNILIDFYRPQYSL